VHELYFAGSYGRAMQFLKNLPGEPVVLDLGGNIGLFSLLAHRHIPRLGFILMSLARRIFRCLN